MSAADRVKLSVGGVDPDAPPEGEESPKDDEDEFDDDKEFHVKKRKK